MLLEACGITLGSATPVAALAGLSRIFWLLRPASRSFLLIPFNNLLTVFHLYIKIIFMHAYDHLSFIMISYLALFASLLVSHHYGLSQSISHKVLVSPSLIVHLVSSSLLKS